MSPGHCLIIPKRHITTFFEATEDENRDFHYLTCQAKKLIEKKYTPDGYNLGSNNGLAAGQSAFHLHLHIIPHFSGVVENPKGGVRWVVPKNASYSLSQYLHKTVNRLSI